MSWPTIDKRILKSLLKQSLASPLPAQSETIPAQLLGRDVVIKSSTGSGKTLAYLIPLVNKLLHAKVSGDIPHLQGIVLVPSKELCIQVHAVLQKLVSYCFDEITCDCFTGATKFRSYKLPRVLVTTPSGLLTLINERGIKEIDCKFLVLDEADLLLTYGYEKALNDVLVKLKKGYQGVLVSATMTEDVNKLQGLFLHDPEIFNIQPQEDIQISSSGISSIQKEFFIPFSEDTEKFLVLFSLIKFEILAGKLLIFTNSMQTAYKLNIFLSKFSISANVLTSTLPIDSRGHLIEMFNQSLIKILIVSETEEESSFSRGIDYVDVSTVINFEPPTNKSIYKHRIGRTNRGKNTNSGTSITFIKEDVHLDCDLSDSWKLLDINMADMIGLKYRVSDTLKSISRKHIKLAEKEQIIREIISNKKVRESTAITTDDLTAMRRQVKLTHQHSKSKAHLKDVPSYLVPKELLETVTDDLTGEETINPVQKAVKEMKRQLGISQGDAGMNSSLLEGTGGIKRKFNEDQTVGFEGKRAKLDLTMRDKMVSKHEEKASTPEELAPISGRKLWKIRHKKSLKSTRLTPGVQVRAKQQQRMNKLAKRFH
jgi:ATP-dependent RNA helicase DDX56/DBP9